MAQQPESAPEDRETRGSEAADEIRGGTARGSDRKGGKAASRRGGMRALAAALAKVTRPLAGRRGLAEGDLLTDWPSVVGAHIAGISAPRQLRFRSRKERSDGTLTLRVEPGHALALQHLEPQLLERINSHLGYAAVARLKFQQGPIPRPREPESQRRDALEPGEARRLGERTAAVEDPELRAALQRLGEAMARRRGSDRAERSTAPSGGCG